MIARYPDYAISITLTYFLYIFSIVLNTSDLLPVPDCSSYEWHIIRFFALP